MKCFNTRRFLSLLIILTTIICSTTIYFLNRPNGYEIFIGDKSIAYVRQIDMAERILRKLSIEEKKRFNIDIKDISSIKNVIVNEADLIDDENLIVKNALLNISVDVNALVMMSDGRQVALVASEKEGTEVLNLIRDYYANKNKITLKESKLKNNITYTKKEVLAYQIKLPKDIARDIEQANEKLKNPLINIEIKGNIEANEVIYPATTINWSKDLLVGESKVKSNGENGVKVVHKNVTLENNKVLNSTLIDEKILVNSKDKIILKGIKSPVITQVSLLAVPSRGSITSGFGSRWGKVHEGIDIGALMGAPICAALDGVVYFAGWEDGYGNVIKIKHDNSLETVYGHCSKILVVKGQKVKRSEKIGLVGSTGRSTGPHLHFEVRVNGQPKNPTAYLK